jgi:A/G-specific adenine glycosylase
MSAAMATRRHGIHQDRSWGRDKIRRFQRRLLAWYETRRRNLPWRADPNPYRVWVSEIMLQQTQVRTVVPYYEQFLARFPDLESLARASEGEVLSLWAGLGYYSRARNLRLAARKMMLEFNGRFPDRIEDLRRLPGVGRYTAGAIQSIAFNSPQPIVDGNVKRVISRLHGILSGAPESFFWKQAGAWVSRERPADFNQAVMDLGALVCTHRNPGCADCPVLRFCKARKRGFQDRIPAPRCGRPTETVELVMLILQKRDRLLVCDRGALPYIPGQWALPTAIWASGDSPEETAGKLARRIFGFSMRWSARVRINHAITYRRLIAHAFYAAIGPGSTRRPAPPGHQWVSRSQLDRLITSALYRKALAV